MSIHSVTIWSFDSAEWKDFLPILQVPIIAVALQAHEQNLGPCDRLLTDWLPTHCHQLSPWPDPATPPDALCTIIVLAGAFFHASTVSCAMPRASIHRPARASIHILVRVFLHERSLTCERRPQLPWHKRRTQPSFTCLASFVKEGLGGAQREALGTVQEKQRLHQCKKKKAWKKPPASTVVMHCAAGRTGRGQRWQQVSGQQMGGVQELAEEAGPYLTRAWGC